MTTLIHDPVGLAECAVIIACVSFCVWWFSPSQRSKRRRERARDRALLRRAITNPSTYAAAREPVLSTPLDQGKEK